jgi:hypothetical protein
MANPSRLAIANLLDKLAVISILPGISAEFSNQINPN